MAAANRVKVTLRADIERGKLEIPQHKGKDRDGKPLPLARSCKGPLPYRPGETLLVTADEQKFIRTNHPDLLPELHTYMVPATTPPVQIEIPSSKGKDPKGKPIPLSRSRAGSLHFRPGTSLELTADERDFLHANHPTLFRQLRCCKPGPALGRVLERAGKNLEALRADKLRRAAAAPLRLPDTDPPPSP